MNNILPTLYKLMFVFIPLPLFYDFGRLSFLYVRLEDFNFTIDRPLIPMPIGAISFFFAILIGYICSLAYPQRFKSVLPPAKLFTFYLSIVLPLALYATFISGLSLPRLAQLLLPMIFISLLSFPTYLQDRIGILRITLFSAFIYYTTHFISVIYTSTDFLNVNPTHEFSNIFGILIYQSLVSYPAVMSLYFFLSLGLIYAMSKGLLPELRKYKFYVYVIIFILLYLLAASGRRAFLVEFVSGFSIILILSTLLGFKFRFVKKRTVIYLSLFLCLFAAFFIFYISTPLSERVLTSIEENTFDSGRVDILGNALSFFSSNLDVLFFGGGVKETPGFHNFVLDQVYRVGVVGLVSVYLTMVVLVRKFIKTIDVGSNYKTHRYVFVLVLLASLFLQSMINASVSQPYYFVNFLTVIMFIYFILFSRDNNIQQAS